MATGGGQRGQGGGIRLRHGGAESSRKGFFEYLSLEERRTLLFSPANNTELVWHFRTQISPCSSEAYEAGHANAHLFCHPLCWLTH